MFLSTGTPALQAPSAAIFEAAQRAIPTPVGNFKINRGHYMGSDNIDGTGADNNSEFSLLANSPAVIGWAGVYNWATLETSKGVYNFQNTIITDFLSLQKTAPGKRLAAWIKGVGFLGSGAITSSNYTTFDGDQGFIPSYIINCGGSLTSPDGTCSTTAAPKSPNPNQYFWMASEWDGSSSYSYQFGGHLYHPVPAQCLLNCYQALCATIIPAGTYGGVYYPAMPFGAHPLAECVGSWDEMSGSFNGGGGFIAYPATDNTVRVNGVTQSVAPTTTAYFAAREQLLGGAAKAFTQMGVVSSLSYTIEGSDGQNTFQQLQTHMKNLLALRVEFGGADVFGTSYGMNFPAGTPWSDGTYPHYGHSTTAQLLLIGGSYANMNSYSSTFQFPHANPASPPGSNSGISPGGYDFTGMPVTAFIEDGDLNSYLPEGVTAETANVIKAIFNAGEFQKTLRYFWPVSDPSFNNAKWTATYYPTIAALPQPAAPIPSAYLAASNVPSAPGAVLATATTGAAVIMFSMPASNGSPITKFVSTCSDGTTATTSAITNPVTGISCRINHTGLTAGSSKTFTVVAYNANGAGPSSAVSNAVTPLAASDYYVACGPGIAEGNPSWSDNYSYGVNVYYVLPGAAAQNGSGNVAPQPLTSGTRVVEVDTVGAYGGWLPHFVNPLLNGSNGRFDLTPYSKFKYAVWPTRSGQTIQTNFEASIWVNFVATGGSSTTAADSAQNWPTNQFETGGWSFDDLTEGINETAISANSATGLTFNANGGAVSAGNYCEIQQPDVSYGNSLQMPNSAYGPATLTPFAWNVVTVPLSAFGVVGLEMLKMSLQDNTGVYPNTNYFCDVGFLV